MIDGNRKLVQRIFRNARFIDFLGIELTSFGLGWCETRLSSSRAHQQQHGFIHAGVLMTIADHTCGGAAASTVSEEADVITVENKTSFLRPATSSVVVCRAEVLRSGKHLVFVEAAITAESEEGKVLIAKASSTLAVIPRNRPIQSEKNKGANRSR